LGTNDNNSLTLRTNQTNIVTITTAGNVGINNATASYTLDTIGNVRISSSLSVGNINPNGTTGRIDASSDIVAFSSSDERLKENIKPIEDSLEKVLKLNGVEFDWRKETKSAHGYEGHDIGVIAQEIKEILPEAVRTNDTGYYAVRYEKIIPILIEAIKDLKKEIDDLKNGKIK
jgi:hypothetical protein